MVGGNWDRSGKEGVWCEVGVEGVEETGVESTWVGEGVVSVEGMCS